MKKQLTTVQQNKRKRIIKRIIYGIILAIAIPATYIYCSNSFNDFFESLNTDISVSTTKTTNKKHITKVDNTDKETNVTGIENDENIVLNNSHKYTSNISEKKDAEETTNNSTTTINNNDDNNDNIEDRFSSFEPSISTDNTDSNEKTNTALSVPKEIEDEYLTNKSNISQSTLEEINKNNEEIAKIEQQSEELDAIKSKYETKVSAIEAWYNEEFNKNYELMIEAKNKYEELGGYASQEDKTTALNKLNSADQELVNSGLSNSGYAANYKKTLQEEYELVCKRYTYSQEYDEYYEYIYTTLPSKKTEKLSPVVQEYNEDLQSYKNKYGL